MTELTKAIHKARPKLKDIAPLTDAIIKCFAVFNVLLGLSLLQLTGTEGSSPTLAVVTNFFSYKFWAGIFIILAILKFYSLWKNNWELMRHTLITAVFIKSLWFIAIIMQILQGQGVYAIAILWSFITAVQISTYIFFAPGYYVKGKRLNHGS